MSYERQNCALFVSLMLASPRQAFEMEHYKDFEKFDKKLFTELKAEITRFNRGKLPAKFRPMTKAEQQNIKLWLYNRMDKDPSVYDTTKHLYDGVMWFESMGNDGV